MSNRRKIPSGLQMPVTREDLATSEIMIGMSIGQRGNTRVYSNDRNTNNPGRRSTPPPPRHANQDPRYDYQDARHTTLNSNYANNDITTIPYTPQTTITTANTNPYPQSHAIPEYQPMHTNPSYQPMQANQYQPVNTTNINPSYQPMKVNQYQPVNNTNINPSYQPVQVNLYQPVNTTNINPSYQPVQANPYQPINTTNTNLPQAADVYRPQACSNCWVYGHSIRRCPQLPCSKCGIIGHFTFDCPEKIKERKEAAKDSRRKRQHGDH